MQEHTIHQRCKEAGGAPYISEWFGPGEWVKLKFNVVWLDLWYLKGLELRLAWGESKWSLKGNMMDSGEKDVRHQKRRSAWCCVRWSTWVLMVMQNEIEGRKSRPRSADGDWGAPNIADEHHWVGGMKPRHHVQFEFDECNGFGRNAICHRGRAKFTSIFILRKHNCTLLSSGILRQRTMNSCGHKR